MTIFVNIPHTIKDVIIGFVEEYGLVDNDYNLEECVMDYLIKIGEISMEEK